MMAKPKVNTIQDLLSMHNYFNRLDGTKSETTKEIINEIEQRVLNHIRSNPTQMDISNGKPEVR